jgi:hypothetical protein
MNELQGLNELREKIKYLADKGVKKAAKAGVNAGLQPLLSGIRQEINGAPISAELKAAIRKTLGKRLKKQGDDYVGKAGFGVGQASKKKKEAARARAGRGQKGIRGLTGEERGVGVSSANIHWFVLGTQQRQTKSGHATGKIEALLAGFIAKAAQSAGPRITAAAAERIQKVLAAEAAKKKG